MPKKNPFASYEADFARLEALTDQLENGELPLGASFAAYEEGIKLVGQLTELLHQGDARLAELTQAGERALTLDKEADA